MCNAVYSGLYLYEILAETPGYTLSVKNTVGTNQVRTYLLNLPISVHVTINKLCESWKDVIIVI